MKRIECMFFFFILKTKEAMEQKVMLKYKLFQPVTPTILSQVENSTIQLESLAWISTNRSTIYRIILSHCYLVIFQNHSIQKIPICFTELKSDLKFSRIFKKKTVQGFKLIHPNAETVQIFIQFEQLAKMWITQLSKSLNQIGFQNIYKTVRKIAKTTSAKIFEVERINDKKKFAAKSYSLEYLNSKEQRLKSVEGEIEMLKCLCHQNINSFEGVLQSQNAIYIVVEILNGGNLFQRINSSLGFSLNETKEIMKGISEGISYLHQFSIMHRDLKLQNVMLRDKNELKVVIVDFGLAAFTEDIPYVHSKCGTPGYIAPELINMGINQKIDKGCDIYSMGAIFHILLTNQYLFNGDNTMEIYQSNKSASFDPTLPLYANIDSSAMDLLSKMLTISIQDRITIQQVLNHQFLRGAEEVEEKEAVSPVPTFSSVGQQRYQI